MLEAIEEAADRLYCGEFETPPVSKDTFVELLKLASTNVIMSTHDGYYMQKDGLAMGSPPAPLLANIWLAKREPAIHPLLHQGTLAQFENRHILCKCTLVTSGLEEERVIQFQKSNPNHQ